MAEEQADRSLTDHRHPPTRDVYAIELVQHRTQRLHDRRLDVAELVVELHDRVLTRDEVLGESFVSVGPADDPRTALGIPDDLVQRIARLTE